MNAIDKPQIFHLLQPGLKIPGDWFNFNIPENIEVGKNTMIDSSYCFMNYHSIRKPGFIAGDHVTLWRTSLATEEKGCIEIGDYSYIQNALLVCADKITIGKFVMIAGGVTIADSDFHPLSPAGRLADTVALSPLGNRHKRQMMKVLPVNIKDDVWIGFNATILKGVTIGRGAIIQPGAVVIGDVEDGEIVAGNPAVKIGVAI